MTRRSYQQNCSLAHAGDLLGDRWTMLIFRELLIQPCQFSDLNRYLGGMGTNLLSQRLKELESHGFVEKADPGLRRSPYQLTDDGRSVEPLVLETIRWGYRYGEAGRDFVHEDHWDLLAMKAFFNAARASKTMVVQFASDALTAWVRVGPDGFEHGMGEMDEPGLVVRSTILKFQLDMAAGVYSDSAIAQAFVRCFELPARRHQSQS